MAWRCRSRRSWWRSSGTGSRSARRQSCSPAAPRSRNAMASDATAADPTASNPTAPDPTPPDAAARRPPPDGGTTGGSVSVQRKIRVAVVFGGKGPEHAVSCMGGGNMLGAIDRDRYEVIPVGITREGNWVLAADERGRL